MSFLTIFPRPVRASRPTRPNPRQWPRRLLAAALLATTPLRAAPPVDLEGRPTLGAKTAPVLVIEVSSFKCSHCRTFHEKIFPLLREKYIDAGKVQWVVLNASDDPAEQFANIFPLARCAQRQGKYWELLDSFFAVAHRAPSQLEALIARSPLLDRSELELCRRDRAVRLAVAADFTEYARLKLPGTPSFLVSKVGRNGDRIETTIAGAQTLDYFVRVLDEILRAP